MTLLAQIASTTFPFFALVLCGFLAARARLVPLEGIPGLNIFVMYLALPCMLFRFAAATPIVQLLDPGTTVTYLACAGVMLALAMVSSRRAGLDWNNSAYGALVAAFPNSGFMGVPLLVAMLGAAAAGPAIVTLAVDMVITASLAIALSRLDGARGREGQPGAGQAVAKALRGMATNPLPWAMLLGALVSATGVQLPSVVMSPIRLLGDAASPVALFTLGCVLARSYLLSQAADLGRTNADASSAPRAMPGVARSTGLGGSVGVIVAFKLLAHPALVYAMGHGARALGVPLDPFALLVLVLVAALPAASNVPILAERFGADAGRIAMIVLVSTALAFVSFTLIVAAIVPPDLLVR
jgi:predicted permease